MDTEIFSSNIEKTEKSEIFIRSGIVSVGFDDISI